MSIACPLIAFGQSHSAGNGQTCVEGSARASYRAKSPAAARYHSDRTALAARISAFDSASPRSISQINAGFRSAWVPGSAYSAPRLPAAAHDRSTVQLCHNASAGNGGATGSTAQPSPSNTRSVASHSSAIPGSTGQAPPQSSSQPIRLPATAARRSPAAKARPPGVRGSGPASVSSSAARSATFRAIGPSVASGCRTISPCGSPGTIP